ITQENEEQDAKTIAEADLFEDLNSLEQINANTSNKESEPSTDPLKGPNSNVDDPALKLNREDSSDDSQLQVEITISNLGWWVSENDIRNTCALVGVDKSITELVFLENKANGKSKGAYSGDMAIVNYTLQQPQISKISASKDEMFNKRGQAPMPMNPRLPMHAGGMHPIPLNMQRPQMNFMVPMQMQMQGIGLNPNQIQAQQMMNRNSYAFPGHPGFMMQQRMSNIPQNTMQPRPPGHPPNVPSPVKNNPAPSTPQKRKADDNS
ncbi:hypothetical protein BB560_004949, partial [Smittium megazygosporum]